MASPIPIQNLYYMFCYAWDRLEESSCVDVGGTDSPELADLFAKVLIGGVRHLLRRGIDRQYLERDDTLTTVRGRIDISRSMLLVMRRAPRLHCEFDELNADTVTNQVLKATLLRLARVDNIDPGLAHDLRILAKLFSDITDLRVSSQHFRQVQLHRNNAFYGFLLNVCQLIYESTLPDETTGHYRFADILRDERKMALVFQAFVRNFLRIEQSRYDVRPLQLRWDAVGADEDIDLLPKMTTDIHLVAENERIIIDTKYYREAFQEYYGKRSLRSDHLYQLFAYLKNAEALGPKYADVKGILLYPTVGDTPPFSATMQGHQVRLLSIDLNQPWKAIREELLSKLGCSTPP